MLESHISKLLIIQPTSQAFLSPSSRRDVVLQRCALLQLHMRSQRNFLRMSENSASSWPCSWVLPDKEGKQTVQNQSICLNFLGWWCYKKSLVIKNYFANMRSCMLCIALQGAFHTKGTCLWCWSLLCERTHFSSQQPPSQAANSAQHYYYSGLLVCVFYLHSWIKCFTWNKVPLPFGEAGLKRCSCLASSAFRGALTIPRQGIKINSATRTK